MSMKFERDERKFDFHDIGCQIRILFDFVSKMHLVSGLRPLKPPNIIKIWLGCNLAPKKRVFGCIVNAKSGGLGATMHPDFFKNPTAILLGCNIAPRFRQFGCMVNAKSGGLGATMHPRIFNEICCFSIGCNLAPKTVHYAPKSSSAPWIWLCFFWL